MAVISPTTNNNNPSFAVHTWSGVTEADTCAPAPIDATPRSLTVQFSGTFGGATAIMQGSNDLAFSLAAPLDDVEDVAVSSTSAGSWELRYAWPFVRPSASGGTGQSLTITLAVGY